MAWSGIPSFEEILLCDGRSVRYGIQQVAFSVETDMPIVGDSWFGGDADETLFASAEVWRLYGGNGNDKYRVNLTDGASNTVFIQESLGGGQDTIWVEGVLPADLRLWNDRAHLYIALPDAGGWRTVARVATVGEGSPDAPPEWIYVERIRFDDGTIWNLPDGQYLVDTDASHVSYGSDASNDYINGQGGNDSLYGGAGNDTIDAGSGADSLFGGQGDDVFIADVRDGTSNTIFIGEDPGGGRDRLIVRGNGVLPTNVEDLELLDDGTSGTGNAEANRIYGGDGSQRLIGLEGNDSLYSGDGTDTLNGGLGDDFLFGGATDADLRDVMFGGDGNDSIDGGAGNDALNGGAGRDSLVGGLGSDTMIGNEDADVLSGGGGSDLMFGNDGDDFLNGGFGFDRINGGAGADIFFHLGIADHGSDWIQDYAAADGDVLAVGIAGATRSQFQVNFAATAGAGAAGVQEAFVIFRPTGHILFALVDGAGQASININLGGQVFDLLA